MMVRPGHAGVHVQPVLECFYIQGLRGEAAPPSRLTTRGTARVIRSFDL